MSNQLKYILQRIYKLLIINTLDTISEIDTVVEGTVVSVFGVVITGAVWLLFRGTALNFSAEISLLGCYAYLAVLIYHVLKHEKDKKSQDYTAESVRGIVVFMSASVLVLVMLLIVNKALFVAGLDGGVRTGLAGIIAILLPLVVWEKLCDWTPVDEIVGRVMR